MVVNGSTSAGPTSIASRSWRRRASASSSTWLPSGSTARSTRPSASSTAHGAELAENRRDTFGADPFLDVTLPEDGRYFLKVHDVTYAGSPEHVYRLTLRDGRPYLDAAEPPIARYPGRLRDRPDADRTRDRRRAASLRRIDGRPVEGKRWLGTPKFVPAPDLPVNALGTAAATRAFPIRLGPEGTPSNPLLIAEADAPAVEEREPNGIESPQAIAPPCSIGGYFGIRNDLDVFRFSARKGESWRIEATAEGIGSPADPAFIVQRVPGSGEPEDLATADDTPDPGLAPRFNLATIDARLAWTAPADGTYQVLLSDVASSSRGDPRLAYRLTIRRDRPDFRLFVVPTAINALDASTVRKGGRAGAVVLAWRLDGFSGPILVRPEGLPEGVRCDPVVIPAGRRVGPDRRRGRPLGEAFRRPRPARRPCLDGRHEAPCPGTSPPESWNGPDLHPRRRSYGLDPLHFSSSRLRSRGSP